MFCKVLPAGPSPWLELLVLKYYSNTFMFISCRQVSEHNSVKESDNDLESSSDEEADSANKEEASNIAGTSYFVSEELLGAKVKTV